MFAMQITDQEFNNKTYIDMMALINCGRGEEGDDVEVPQLGQRGGGDCFSFIYVKLY